MMGQNNPWSPWSAVAVVGFFGLVGLFYEWAESPPTYSWRLDVVAFHAVLIVAGAFAGSATARRRRK